MENPSSDLPGVPNLDSSATQVTDATSQVTSPTEVKPVTCADCGCTSTLRSQFVWMYANSAFLKAFCPACQEARAVMMSWCYLGAIATLFFFGLMIPYGGLQVLMLAPAVGTLISLLMMPLHEFAHALTAVALGVPVYKIQLGHCGPLLYRLRIGRCELDLRLPPVGGFIQPAFRSPQGLRWRFALITLAGPLVHVPVLWMGCELFVRSNQGQASLLALALIYSGVVDLARNLYPNTYPSISGPAANDGMLLISLPFMPTAMLENTVIFSYFMECTSLLSHDDVDRAAAVCREGLQRFPDDLHLKAMSGICELEQGRPEQAYSTLQSLLSHADITPEFEAIIHGNLAWCGLETAYASRLPDALAESKQAFDALPWLPEIQGTRGSILIEAGEFDTGIPLLKSAFRKNESASGRAWNAAYLALAHVRQSEFEQALDQLNTAEKLNSACRLIARVRKLLEQQA